MIISPVPPNLVQPPSIGGSPRIRHIPHWVLLDATVTKQASDICFNRRSKLAQFGNEFAGNQTHTG